MFFFFVGGLEQQVRQVLKSGAGRCISCRSAANLVNYDKVLKVFFVPVWRWPGKDPLMHCNNCNLFFPPDFSLPPTGDRSGAITKDIRCRFCNRVVEPDFSFCPFLRKGFAGSDQRLKYMEFAGSSLHLLGNLYVLLKTKIYGKSLSLPLGFKGLTSSRIEFQ